MQEKQFVIQDAAGLHARPAEILVSRLQHYPCGIRMAKGTRSVNGKDLMAVMSLGVRKGETLQVMMEGEQEQEAMAALEAAMTECGLIR